MYNYNEQVHKKKENMKNFIKITLSLSIILATILGCLLYVNDYYRADDKAILEYTEQTDDNVTIQYKNNRINVSAENATAALIFYPGGKVEYTAYLPLMLALAECGISSVLIKMPLNLAVLDVNAADGVKEDLPKIENWYIGGHSLGGSMAASYLEGKSDLSGLVLLGSYSTADVTGSRVLSIYGENDGVMNREKYEKYKSNLPKDFTEVVISGGNHAGFGCYGEQDGDGKATILNTTQIRLTAELISDFINK
jgi:hypothetical protein